MKSAKKKILAVRDTCAVVGAGKQDCSRGKKGMKGKRNESESFLRGWWLVLSLFSQTHHSEGWREQCLSGSLWCL